MTNQKLYVKEGGLRKLTFK